ncbi:hypothetical protein [Nostoc sp. C052]|nr:hypothetical protein [Nostoc sp. C052]
MTISLSLAITLPTQSPIPIFLLGDRTSPLLTPLLKTQIFPANA